MDYSTHNIALECVRATEAAAVAAVAWVGKGDAKQADKAATDAMRRVFNTIACDGLVVSGEGKKDQAPQLYEGEKVGIGNGTRVEFAVDPLECTDSVAHGRPNASSVIAGGVPGSFMHMPDMYMDKIAVGPGAKGVIDLRKSVAENIDAVARALGKPISDMGVMLLERERHTQLIADIRKTGARVFLISDGDMAGAISAALPDSPIDMLFNTGAAVEGVQSAIALKCLGGDFQGRLAPKNEEQRAEARAMGYDDVSTIYTIDDLVPGADVFVVATGIIDGPILSGVAFDSFGPITHSLMLHNSTKTSRFIRSRTLTRI